MVFAVGDSLLSKTCFVLQTSAMSRTSFPCFLTLSESAFDKESVMRFLCAMLVAETPECLFAAALLNMHVIL